MPAVTKILRDSRIRYVHLGDTVRDTRAGDHLDLQHVGWQTLHLHVEGLHHLKPGRVAPVSERHEAAVYVRPIPLSTGYLKDLPVDRVNDTRVKGCPVTKAIEAVPVNVTVLRDD